MKCLFKKTCNTNASARVVDGKLILSLPNALTPVVWQMDVSDVKTSAIESHTDEKSGQHTLRFISTGKTAKDIASFEKKEDAIDALMAVSGALENAHGSIKPKENVGGAQPVYAPMRPKRPWWKYVLVILGILIALFVLANIMVSSTGVPTNRQNVNNVAQETQSEAGVPMSADQFLQR